MKKKEELSNPIVKWGSPIISASILVTSYFFVESWWGLQVGFIVCSLAVTLFSLLGNRPPNHKDSAYDSMFDRMSDELLPTAFLICVIQTLQILSWFISKFPKDMPPYIFILCLLVGIIVMFLWMLITSLFALILFNLSASPETGSQLSDERITGKADRDGESQIDGVFNVPNPYGVGDGSQLIIEESPDLMRIFSDPDPPMPLKSTDKNRDYWKDADIEEKRYVLAEAYLQHPNPSIRIATIGFARDVKTFKVSLALVPLLADYDSNVCHAAATLIWERQRDENCEYAVLTIRDYLRGHTSIGITTPVRLLWSQATRALDLLVSVAPSEDARKALQDIIDRNVVIEERIMELDISSVQFSGIEHKRGFTYEVYRAESKEQALAFLKTKKVDKMEYYIEVETPDGEFGRDIDGIYGL